MTQATPFAALTPDAVLDAAAAAGIDVDGRLFALNSYENRVYRVGTHVGPSLILKFYRPARWSDAQILEEHAFARELVARDLDIAAPHEIDGSTLRHVHGQRLAVFDTLAGRAPELDTAESLTVLGRALGRMHATGATRTFRVRPRLSVERLGHQARKAVLTSGFVPPALEARYASVSAELIAGVEREFALTAGVHAIRLHGDCHLGNLLWGESGPVFVDLDDCMMGPRIQDLWMLLAGSSDDQRRTWDALSEGYRQFADFDYLELRLVEPLRALRMLHHAAWLAQRWHDPAFPRAFPWFGEARFWERHVLELLEQRAAIDEPPILSA